MNFTRPRRRNPGENVVPLINVVFLLLIFFMLAGTLRPPEANRLQLPTTTRSHPDPPTPQSRPVLALDAAGRVFRDGQSLSPSEVRSLRAPDGLELRADRGVPAGILLPLLEALEEAGVERLELVTRRAR